MQEGPGNLNRDNIIFERREFVRIDGTFVVSYCDIKSSDRKYDLSQTKNISLSGILFTTDRQFQPGAILRVGLRLPNSADYLYAKVKVIDSKERIKGVMYDTRAKFIGIRDEDKDAIKRIVEYNIRQEKNRG